jgi:hypothetical protein
LKLIKSKTAIYYLWKIEFWILLYFWRVLRFSKIFEEYEDFWRILRFWKIFEELLNVSILRIEISKNIWRFLNNMTTINWKILKKIKIFKEFRDFKDCRFFVENKINNPLDMSTIQKVLLSVAYIFTHSHTHTYHVVELSLSRSKYVFQLLLIYCQSHFCSLSNNIYVFGIGAFVEWSWRLFFENCGNNWAKLSQYFEF